MIDKYFIENLFGINGLNIAWYGVIIGVGILLGILIACREAKTGTKVILSLIFSFLALLSQHCARIYYVVFNGNSI